MTLRHSWALALGMTLLMGCTRCGSTTAQKTDGEISHPEAPADLVLRDGRVYTADAAGTWAEALAIRDGALVHVGTNEGAVAWVGADTEVIELGQRLVLPGFHDLHLHVPEAGINEALCLLTPGLSVAEYIDELRGCVAEQPGGGWLRAAGASSYTLQDGDQLPIEALDALLGDRPAMILDDLGHGLWTNSAGLKAAGIAANAPDPQGGIFERDPDSGVLTGLLYEDAQHLVRNAAMFTPAEVDAGLASALAVLAEHGVTTVSDAGGYWTQGHDAAWRRAADADTLTVRAYNSLYLFPAMDRATQLAALRERARFDGDSLLRFDTIKIYIDGILDLGTALLLAPYEADWLDPGHTGFAYFDRAELDAYALALHADGFRFNFHVVGDAGVRTALDVVETVAARYPGAADRGHRTTHNYLVDPADLARFATLGVTADLQVGVDAVSAAYRDSLDDLIGARAERLLPVRDLHDAGAHVTLSSDWDADELPPFGIIERALTRDRQALADVATAVRMLTIRPAETVGHADRVGSLEVGKRADLVVADRDIFEAAPADIGQARVLLTMLDGEVIYRRPGAGL